MVEFADFKFTMTRHSLNQNRPLHLETSLPDVNQAVSGQQTVQDATAPGQSSEDDEQGLINYLSTLNLIFGRFFWQTDSFFFVHVIVK